MPTPDASRVPSAGRPPTLPPSTGNASSAPVAHGSPGSVALTLGPPPPVPGQPTDQFVPAPFPDASRPDAPKIESLFTPGKHVQKVELAALDEVIRARKADPRTFAPGENPYRILYAIYNMTDQDVIPKLAEAKRAGVHVQVLIDANQIGDHKPHNTVVQQLVDKGFTHATSHKGLSKEQAEKTDIIEIDLPGEGLFHLKLRYFEYPDRETGEVKRAVLSGSHNPQNTAHKNDESFHVIHDPFLIDRYLEAYFAVRDDRPLKNQWRADGANVLFTGPKVEGPRALDKLFEAASGQDELALLAVFALRDVVNGSGQKLSDALGGLLGQGAKVVAATDIKSSDGRSYDGSAPQHANDDPMDERLVEAGATVYEFQNPTSERSAMHLRAGVYGLSDPVVVTDTANWTKAALGSGSGRAKNVDSLLVIEGHYDQQHTARRYIGEILRVLRKYAFQNPDRKPVEDVIQELQALPNWPQVGLGFRLTDVPAKAGERVFLVGDHPAFEPADGKPGLELSADAGVPGAWRSADVQVPLGQRLTYRLALRGQDGAVRFAPGEPRILIADPTLGARSDAMVAEDRWSS